MGDLNTRIFNILAEKKLKAKDMAMFIGVTEGVVSAWKKRGTDPKAIYVKKIAEFLQVTENYLLTGEIATDITNEKQISPELKDLFDACKKASSEDIKLVTEMLKRMSEGKEG